jgi:hypothetical protein
LKTLDTPHLNPLPKGEEARYREGFEALSLWERIG